MLNSVKSFNVVFSNSPTVPKCKPVVNIGRIESFIYLGQPFISDERYGKHKKENSHSKIYLQDVLTSRIILNTCKVKSTHMLCQVDSLVGL